MEAVDKRPEPLRLFLDLAKMALALWHLLKLARFFPEYFFLLLDPFLPLPFFLVLPFSFFVFASHPKQNPSYMGLPSY